MTFETLQTEVKEYTGILRRADATARALLGRSPAQVEVRYSIQEVKKYLYDFDVRLNVQAITKNAGIGGGRSAAAYGQVSLHRTGSGTWSTNSDSLHSDSLEQEWGVLVAHPVGQNGSDYFTGEKVIECLRLLVESKISCNALDQLVGIGEGSFDLQELQKPDWAIHDQGENYRWIGQTDPIDTARVAEFLKICYSRYYCSGEDDREITSPPIGVPAVLVDFRGKTSLNSLLSLDLGVEYTGYLLPEPLVQSRSYGRCRDIAVCTVAGDLYHYAHYAGEEEACWHRCSKRSAQWCDENVVFE